MAYLLHHLLIESAQRYPDQEAARFEGQGLTYRQLDLLTNQVARALREAGVQRGDRVGIYVHKSFASLISMFGILKSGGIFVPLDPNAPAPRLAFITRNCDIQVLLTAAEKLDGVAAILAEGSPLEKALLIDSPGPLETPQPSGLEVIPWEYVTDLPVDPVPDPGSIETDLAYILYTSGSTGDPKGVMISHRTIFTFVDWCYETFDLTPQDRITSHAPIHFDLSTFDIYVTIKAGGTIILIPDKLSVFPVKLVKLLQEEKVTGIYMVPSVLSLMVNYGKLADHDLSALKLILFAGEVFPIKYLRRLVELLPDAEYYNLYGPTETNVCTYYKVKPEDIGPDRTQPVPIGKACENMEILVVDEDEKLITERGQEGELWVRGSCVASGYWGDQEKTSKGFIRNPFQPHFDEPAYRTGDVVTLTDDGENWIYVGRRDHMIKSRGYRIELGEIEAVLYNYSGIKEAAVIAIPDDLIGNRIKAVVVLKEQNGVSTKEIQNHCSQQLPRYMVPEIIEFLDELPKTSTGKVNRTLLAKSTL